MIKSMLRVQTQQLLDLQKQLGEVQLENAALLADVVDLEKQVYEVQLENQALLADKRRLDKLEAMLKDGISMPFTDKDMQLQRMVLLSIPRNETIRQFLDSAQ